MAGFEDWEQDLVNTERVARLATISPNGLPHLVPVCFALVQGDIAIAIDEKPKRHTPLARIRNIQRDARVSVLFDRYADEWTQLAWVRVEGEAEVLERGDNWLSALQALRERYHQYGTMRLEELPVIRIRPVRVVSWRWDG